MSPYDLGRLLGWHAEGGILSVLFLLASASALYAVWSLQGKALIAAKAAAVT